MFLVQLSLIVNLLKVILVWLTNFLKLFVTIPVAPILTGMILHFILSLYMISDIVISSSPPLPFA